MNRKLIQTALVLLGSFSCLAQGVQFQQFDNWQAVLKKAQETGKYIFVDCYTTWCGPCKLMDKNVYPDARLGAFMQDKIIAIKVQMDTTTADGEYVRNWYADAHNLFKQFRIRAFPTLAFVSPSGKLVHYDIGFKDTASMHRLVSQAIDPSSQYLVLLDKYYTGTIKPKEQMLLAKYAVNVREKDTGHSVAQAYINSLSEQALLQKEALAFLIQFTWNVKDRGFDFLKKYRNDVNKVMGKSTAEIARRNVIAWHVLSALRQSQTAPDYVKIESDIADKYGEDGKRGAYMALSGYAWEKGDVDHFVIYKNKTHLKWASDISFFSMNDDAWWVFERTGKRQQLESALKWQNKVLEGEKKSPTIIDTYANILYRLGRKKEAIEWEQKAVDMEERDSPDPAKIFRETLEKMKKDEATWPQNVNPNNIQ